MVNLGLSLMKLIIQSIDNTSERMDLTHITYGSNFSLVLEILNKSVIKIVCQAESEDIFWKTILDLFVFD